MARNGHLVLAVAPVIGGDRPLCPELVFWDVRLPVLPWRCSGSPTGETQHDAEKKQHDVLASASAVDCCAIASGGDRGPG
jgi:hypothetical protein